MEEVLEKYTIYGYILMYLYLFLIGSMSGFLIEVFYRRFVSVKRWVNPGFMKGPWIPLYGFGVVFMSTITTKINSAFAEHGIYLYNPKDYYLLGLEHGPAIQDLIPIIVMGLGMTLLELIAGLIFVKGFKVRLWDYSNDRGNFMGIICPKFSIIWLLVATLFYYCLSPFIYNLALNNTNNILFPDNEITIPKIWIVLVIGLIYGMILLDFITSIGLFNKVSTAARKIGKILHYDQISENLSLFRKEASDQIKTMMPEQLRKTVSEYQNKESKNTLKYKIKSILYIDPDKTENKNFDELGRPLTDEEYLKRINEEKNKDKNA